MTKILRALLVVMLLVGSPALMTGCSANRDRQTVKPIEPHPPAQTRIAVPVEEERPWYENAGEVAVIVVGAVVIIGGIVAPILILSH